MLEITFFCLAGAALGFAADPCMMDIVAVRDERLLIAEYRGGPVPGESNLFDIVRPVESEYTTIGMARIVRTRAPLCELEILALGANVTVRAGEDRLRRSENQIHPVCIGNGVKRSVRRTRVAGPAANIPAAPAGLFFGGYAHSGFSWFVDFKWQPDKPERNREPFYPGLTFADLESELGHLRTEEWITVSVINLGLTRRLRQNLTCYLGLGLCCSSSYVRGRDPERIMGRDGLYLVRGDEGARSLNLCMGFIWLTGPMFLSFGVDSQLPGISIALGFQY